MKIHHKRLNVFNKFILFFFSLAACFLPAEFFSKSVHAGPVDDIKITVYATGNLNGEFEADHLGQGGLAALLTLTERTRKRSINDSSEVIFLHTGSFSNTKNIKDFTSKVGNSEFNLISYMKYDALLLPANEYSFAVKNSIASACPENKLLKNKKTDFFIKHFEKKNTGIDILCLSKEIEAKDLKSTISSREKTHLFFLLSRIDSAKILSSSSAAEDLPEESPAQNTFIFQSHDAGDYFIRTESGSYICNNSAQSICEIEITLRSGHIISVQQKFFTVNNRAGTLGNYAADAKISEFLSRNPQ